MRPFGRRSPRNRPAVGPVPTSALAANTTAAEFHVGCSSGYSSPAALELATLEVGSGPVAAALGAQELHRPEQHACLLVRADRVERHHHLARLGRGDPRTVRHAAQPAALDRERRPSGRDARVRRVAAQHTAEDRVVPVHRPALLVEEHVGTVGDGDRERAERELPVGPFVIELLRDRDGAPQAQVDARRPGEQRAVVGVVAAPRDLAGLALEVERVVDRRFHHRPELAEVRRVTGGEVVVPRAGRDVAGDVRVERRVLHLVAEVVRVPAAVGALLAAQPLVRRTRLLDAPAEVERHQRLDHVPRIGVAARDPREVAVGELVRGDRGDGRVELARADDAGNVGEAGHATRGLLGVHDEALADHGVQRAVDGVQPRGLPHDLPDEEVVVLADGPGVGVVDTDRALQPPIRGVERVRVVRAAHLQARARELRFEVALAVDADVAAGRVVVVPVERPADALREAGRARSPRAGRPDGGSAPAPRSRARRPRCAPAPRTR